MYNDHIKDFSLLSPNTWSPDLQTKMTVGHSAQRVAAWSPSEDGAECFNVVMRAIALPIFTAYDHFDDIFLKVEDTSHPFNELERDSGLIQGVKWLATPICLPSKVLSAVVVSAIIIANYVIGLLWEITGTVIDTSLRLIVSPLEVTWKHCKKIVKDGLQWNLLINIPLSVVTLPLKMVAQAVQIISEPIFKSLKDVTNNLAAITEAPIKAIDVKYSEDNKKWIRRSWKTAVYLTTGVIYVPTVATQKVGEICASGVKKTIKGINSLAQILHWETPKAKTDIDQNAIIDLNDQD